MKWFQKITHVFRRTSRLHIAIDQGEGESVVLLHGIASSGEAWRPLVTQMADQKARLFAVDLLGFGNSPKPADASYDVIMHAQMVLAALRRARVRPPYTLVGHSMGCLVAVHLAAHHPRLIKRVILFEPPLFVDVPEFRTHQKRRAQYFKFFEYIIERPELALAQGRALFRTIRKLSGFALSNEMWTPFERSLRNTIMNQQAYRELHQIAVPTDIIHGRFDFVVTRADVKEMFTKNKNIKLHIANRFHGISPLSARYLARLIANKDVTETLQ